MYSIPYLGYLANYIQTPPGTYVAIAAGALLLLLVFSPDLFSSDKEKEKKKEASQEAPLMRTLPRNNPKLPPAHAVGQGFFVFFLRIWTEKSE